MNFRKVILITAGFVLLAFGAIGTFIPVLPTTPFVLLAAACFSIGSPKLQKKLKKSEFFKNYIEYYESSKGVAKNIVRRSIIYVWIGLIISILITRKIWIAILLITIGIGVSLYLTSLTER